MNHSDRFDSLIQYWAGAHGLDWRLIKAQVRQESAMNPLAVSPCGAEGLMQLMPATAAELKVSNSFDPDSNLRGGCSYLREQYRRFPEIEDPEERWKFALGAYNAGRGNINRAIAAARVRRLNWQAWDVVASVLPQITGRRSEETIGYVDKIITHWQELKNTTTEKV